MQGHVFLEDNASGSAGLIRRKDTGAAGEIPGSDLPNAKHQTANTSERNPLA